MNSSNLIDSNSGILAARYSALASHAFAFPVSLLKRTARKLLKPALWILALIWMVIIGNWGSLMFVTGGKGVIVGGVLILFAPLPLMMLRNLETPDMDRRRERVNRRRARLGKRILGKRAD